MTPSEKPRRRIGATAGDIADDRLGQLIPGVDRLQERIRVLGRGLCLRWRRTLAPSCNQRFRCRSRSKFEAEGPPHRTGNRRLCRARPPWDTEQRSLRPGRSCPLTARGSAIGVWDRDQRDLAARWRERVAAHDEAWTCACRCVHGVSARPARSRDEWRVRTCLRHPAGG